ncbi:hypothetical protein A5662_05815, partial [Mycobacteriaceae bacterium 1482268.1]
MSAAGYGGPWAVYELPSAQPLLDDLADYYSVTSGQVLIGFFCTGAAARVPGMVEDPTVVDVGLGLHPDHVGRRRGALFARIVLKHLSEVHPGRPLRAVVQAWNRRSLRLTHQLGFVDIGEMTTVQNGKP